MRIGKNKETVFQMFLTGLIFCLFSIIYYLNKQKNVIKNLKLFRIKC